MLSIGNCGGQCGGSLSISLPQGLVFEFSHLTDQIKSRINSFFGYEAIGQINLKPYYPTYDASAAPSNATKTDLSHEEKASLEEALNCIENNELKQALLTLGISVIANQKKV